MGQPAELPGRALLDSPVRVLSGAGSRRRVPEVLRALDCSRVLVVCGRNLARHPALHDLLDEAPELFAGIFGQVESDPSDTTVAAGGRAAADLRADVVVAMGGGSSLDAAKAIAAEARQPGWIAGYAEPGRPTEVPPDVLPVIALPTTAGTASEVTPFSVITFTASRRKLVLNHPALYPRVAVLDPELLLTAPREVRVAAGMDALTHAVESLVSRQATEETRARSLEAAAGIMRHLPGAAAEPPEREDLADVQWAAMVGGLAFSRSRLGIVHAAALPLSARFGVPHGAANAILLPQGMAFNLSAAEARYANLAEVWHVTATGGASAGEAAVQAVRDLAAGIGAPRRLSEVGVDPAALPEMAADALQSAHLAVNPREVTAADLVALYRAAL